LRVTWRDSGSFRAAEEGEREGRETWTILSLGGGLMVAVMHKLGWDFWKE
jgi:hypothetical protein